MKLPVTRLSVSSPSQGLLSPVAAHQSLQQTELPKAGTGVPASHWRHLKEALLSPVPLSQTSWRTDSLQRKCWKAAMIIPVFRWRKRRIQGVLHCLTSTCMKQLFFKSVGGNEQELIWVCQKQALMNFFLQELDPSWVREGVLNKPLMSLNPGWNSPCLHHGGVTQSRPDLLLSWWSRFVINWIFSALISKRLSFPSQELLCWHQDLEDMAVWLCQGCSLITPCGFLIFFLNTSTCWSYHLVLWYYQIIML